MQLRRKIDVVPPRPNVDFDQMHRDVVRNMGDAPLSFHDGTVGVKYGIGPLRGALHPQITARATHLPRRENHTFRRESLTRPL